MKSPGDNQRNNKYEYHDWHLDDLTDWELRRLRDNAINVFVNSNESDQARIVIKAFLLYLTASGFRIVKKDKK